MKYKLHHLVGYFTQYDECSGAAVLVYKPDAHKHKAFHLKITPGSSLASSKIDRVFNGSEEFPLRTANDETRRRSRIRSALQ
jgi:hypothetical protein